MTANEIRASFLDYFERNGHRIVSSAPLVPAEDPTLLFTNAGMNQFKDVFLGRERRDYSRAASVQKCMRVSGKHNDLDNVGPSPRHHTFFEMLGNFSFGDYFKTDAIALAWKLLTDVWKLPADHLVVSVFKGERGIPRDDEAYEVWRKYVPGERILELGTDDNFWQMGDTGPCGRCSEIYYVRSTGHEPEIEIWNNVFMEFERETDGRLSPLPAPSIDTGMGLERITAVLQGKDSNYDTDLFTPLLTGISNLAGRTYGAEAEDDVSLRVIADHIRATVFLIGDGVIPSNEWRGYVLRKIMRRAMRHGKALGVREPFLYRLVEIIDREMGTAYPEVRTSRETIEKTILAEENRFDAVLNEGLPRLESELDSVVSTGVKALPGDVAFKLYDTFGIPYDFIEDTAATRGLEVNRADFDRSMAAQRDRARARGAFGGGDKHVTFDVTDAEELEAIGDPFEGYGATSLQGVPVVALFDDQRQPVDELTAATHGYVVLTRTPFYIEAGGQVSDVGRILNVATGASAGVEGLVRLGPGLPRAHAVAILTGVIRVRDIVTAEVDVARRDATRRSHTATHLLHAALRQVLGGHVKQAGSLVAPDRLRFDFVHFQPVAREELEHIERTVNEQIRRNTAVRTDVRPTEEAIRAGAMALFGEKYGDTVRVVTVPGVSMELCGGTHVGATGVIGAFVIVSESSVAAGVRRIEAITGAGAIDWMLAQRAALQGILQALGTTESQAVGAIERLQSDAKRLTRDVSQLKTKVALAGQVGPSETADSVDVAGIKLARRKVTDLDKDSLRAMADSLKATIKSGVVVLASANNGKVQMVVSVTPDLVDRLKAGRIVKDIAPIIGGGGGGRPDFAEAGGRQPEKIDEMLDASEVVIRKLLGAPGRR